ncbi:MAG: permease [Victivallaceae bacterium]|nr:permease [Victivallaceae bacterium]
MDKIIEFFVNCWLTTTELAPWLLLGLGIAGALHIWIPDNFIKRHLGHGRISAIFKAVIFGVPMPLCSCGVIPAALGIKKQGAGNGAAMGFLISTPQTGVDSIMVSASLLGLPFALFKLVSAFILGIIGGLLSYFSDTAAENSIAEDLSSDNAPPKTCRELLNFAVDDLLKMIWRWLFAGIIISAAITTWLPKDFFQNYLTDNILLAMLLVLLISLPMYVCATASVPIAAALVANGMPIGAALVFLMAGPASNVATIGTVYRAFGIKNLFIYLGTIITGSLFCGWLFSSVIAPHTVQTAMQHHEAGIIPIVATIILGGLMLRFAIMEFKDWFNSHSKSTSDRLTSREFHVTGITCQGCAGKLKTALNALSGIAATEINIESGIVTVSGDSLNDKIISAEIVKCGFTPVTD